MRILIYLSFVFLPQFCFAQFVEKTSFFITPTKSIKEDLSSFRFELDKTVTSVSVRALDKYDFQGSFISVNTDTFLLVLDEHGETSNWKFSKLVIFPQAVKSFVLNINSIRDSIDVFLINDQNTESIDNPGHMQSEEFYSDNFDLPKMIDQSEWRAGLNPPDFERIVHEVHNVIIHHSATSNHVTDYTTAIRNIYLYHTEVRGWSDIGYNYVIAPNGDIYKGRDPGTNEQDLVMGAHFCSSNRGTMGICMLGTFTEVAPTDTAFSSLEKLLVWKLGKDEMDALGRYAHALNDNLHVISGHRDGCSTECPGEVMYSRLGLLRERVHNQIIITGIFLISDNRDTESDIDLFPNPVEGNLSFTSDKKIESISILSLSGKIIKTYVLPAGEIDLSFMTPGMYILDIKSDNNVCRQRIIKI